MSMKEWFLEERRHVSDSITDDFRGVTALQIVSTVALAAAVFIGSTMNITAYYDGFGPDGILFFVVASIASVLVGFVAFLLVRRHPALVAIVPVTVLIMLYIAETQKGLFGIYLAVTVLPGVAGAFGIWRRAVIPLYIGFVQIMASMFIYSNPIDTPIVEVMAFSVLSLVYLETGHIAITFSRVKARVLENQKISAVFTRLYKRVIRRYAISVTEVLVLTGVLTVLLLRMNTILRTFASGVVVHSFEMHSFTGAFISATIGLMALALIRSALPR